MGKDGFKKAQAQSQAKEKGSRPSSVMSTLQKTVMVLCFFFLLAAYILPRLPLAISSQNKGDILDTSASTSSNPPVNEKREAEKPFIPMAVRKAVLAIEQNEGMGAKVRRTIGTSGMRNYTPFLMLDHFKISPDAGFPDHPHRGQETITYVIKGHVDHEDFTGSKGTLGPGDLQFMTAGRGIVHAEMPRIDSEDGNLETVEGIQLWVDLPQELKECEPRYRDLRKDEIPIARPDSKTEIKVISGQSYGVDSIKNLAYTPVWFLDVHLQPGGNIRQKLPSDSNTFLYILEGEIVVNGTLYKQFTNIFFQNEGDGVEVLVPEEFKDTARFIIVAGKILNQPIVQHGPFVETSRERIIKAFQDYQSGTNGFERAVGWESDIGKKMLKGL